MSTANANDTPRKSYRTGSRFAVTGDLETKRAELRYTMHRKITCIHYDKFVEEFLPEAAAAPSKSTLTSSIRAAASLKLQAFTRHSSSKRVTRSSSAATRMPPSTNPFRDMGEPNSEKDMYHKIITALNKADICTGYKFVATPHKSDSSDQSGQAVDCGMYPDDELSRVEVAGDEDFGRTHWSTIEIAIECKSSATSGDPFDEHIDNDVPNADIRRKVLGQILSYMELVFDHQHRTCQYMILFLGDSARIVRVDRSGIFATHKFSYREHGIKLARFLWYYARRSATDRGHDTTAVRLDPRSGEANRMRKRVADVPESDYVAQYFKKLLDEDWPWWKLEVPNEANPKEPRYYLVAKPHFQAPGVAGRATRGYIALPADKKDDTFVYLKDAWRVVSDHIDKEGTILETLREHKVQFVPTLVCHGDVAGQETKAQAVWEKLYPNETCHLKHHKHYRLVMKEVGKSLEEFTNGMELVTALWCCVRAHQQAYAKGIIHRDISAGNILLCQREDGQWYGLLNDWELSKQLVHQEGPGCQPDRTGTWQFLSANALNNPRKTIVVQDELESFFHVLLYIAIRFLHHNCDSDSVPEFLQDYFDAYSPRKAGHRCGTTKLGTMRQGYVDLTTYNETEKGKPDAVLGFLWPGKSTKHKYPLNALFKTVLEWFHAYYDLHPDREGDSDPDSAEDEEEKDAAIAAPSGLLAEIARDMEAEAAEEQNRSDSESSSSSSSPTATRSRKSLEKLARNLDSHTPMLNELYKAMKKKWPTADRCDDRKPQKSERWAPVEDPVAKGSKRSSDVLAERFGKPAKRSRVR
ncbi:hypothetical protein OH77DRAFT_1447806 [Trametes cingulata]|nr:hypothetical protein OH77DRAFT_1447806 [Trametes cingulata]